MFKTVVANKYLTETTEVVGDVQILLNESVFCRGNWGDAKQ